MKFSCKAIRDFFDDLMNKSICDIQNEENSSGRSDLCMNSKDEKRQKAKRRQEVVFYSFNYILKCLQI